MASVRYKFAKVPISLVQRTTGARNNAASKTMPERVQLNDARGTAITRSFHDGTVERVRVGKMPDGKFGLRVWNSAGALIHDLTTT